VAIITATFVPFRRNSGSSDDIGSNFGQSAERAASRHREKNSLWSIQKLAKSSSISVSSFGDTKLLSPLTRQDR
jgi:hypothetical protein